MKEQAFGRDSIGDGIQPQENIVQMKRADTSTFLEISETGARINRRDAKLLLNTFCKAAAEENSSIAAIIEKAPKKISRNVYDFEPQFKTTQTEED